MADKKRKDTARKNKKKCQNKNRNGSKVNSVESDVSADISIIVASGAAQEKIELDVVEEETKLIEQTSLPKLAVGMSISIEDLLPSTAPRDVVKANTEREPGSPDLGAGSDKASSTVETTTPSKHPMPKIGLNRHPSANEHQQWRILKWDPLVPRQQAPPQGDAQQLSKYTSTEQQYSNQSRDDEKLPAPSPVNTEIRHGRIENLSKYPSTEQQYYNEDNEEKPTSPDGAPLKADMDITAPTGEDIERILRRRRHEKDSAGFLCLTDTTFRTLTGIGTPDLSEDGSLEELLEEAKAVGLQTAYPFNKKTAIEENGGEKVILEKLLQIVNEQVNSAFTLACAQKGFLSAKNTSPDSWNAISVLEADGIKEMQFINSLMQKVASEGFYWWKYRYCTQEDCPDYVISRTLNELLPLLESNNEKELLSHGVFDALRSLTTRKELGFEVSVEDVDKMLENSFEEAGLGGFYTFAKEDIDMLQTKKHLELILPRVASVTKLTDIRVKAITKKVIVKILRKLSAEEKNELAAEFAGKCTAGTSFLLSFLPSSGGHCIERAALDDEWDVKDDKPSKDDFALALLMYYLTAPFEDVNHMVYQHMTNSSINWKDRQELAKAFGSLPESLRFRIFAKVTDGSGAKDSLYDEVNSRLTCKTFAADLAVFLRLFSRCDDFRLGHVLNFLMDEVRKGGSNRKNAVLAITSVVAEINLRAGLSKCSDFQVVDLVLLGLEQYKPPKKCELIGKYKFLESVFVSCNRLISENPDTVIDFEKLNERWDKLGHPWYSQFYLLTKYLPAVFLENRKVELPWKASTISEEVFGAGDKDKDVHKYEILARVLIAWPVTDCKEVVHRLVESFQLNVGFHFIARLTEFVPVDVDRAELFKGMKKHLATLEIDPTWKTDLEMVTMDGLIAELEAGVLPKPIENPGSDQSRTAGDLLEGLINTFAQNAASDAHLHEEAELQQVFDERLHRKPHLKSTNSTESGTSNYSHKSDWIPPEIYATMSSDEKRNHLEKRKKKKKVPASNHYMRSRHFEKESTR